MFYFIVFSHIYIFWIGALARVAAQRLFPAGDQLRKSQAAAWRQLFPARTEVWRAHAEAVESS